MKKQTINAVSRTLWREIPRAFHLTPTHLISMSLLNPNAIHHQATRAAVREMFKKRAGYLRAWWNFLGLGRQKWEVKWLPDGVVQVGCMRFGPDEVRVLRKWAGGGV